MLILGGTGRLYGGLIGAAVYMVARDQFSGLNPQYWYFWIGLLLIARRDVPAERHPRRVCAAAAARDALRTKAAP